MCATRTVCICPSSANVSTVATNSNNTTLEANSHTDTTCLRGGNLKLFDYDCPVNIQGYDPTLGVKVYRTISGALAYTHPFTGIRYHLVINQAIHMPELCHHLLCPMKCQANGFTINEFTCIYCNEPNQESRTIVTEDEYGDNVILPFFLNGVTSHLNVDTLTRDEFEAHDCPWLTLTHRDMT